MTQKKVLVTGCNGFIGSLIVNQLLTNSSYQVFGTAKGQNRNPNLPTQNYIEFELLDANKIGQALKNIAPQIIIHTAAISQVDKCENQPELCKSINEDATKEIVQICKELNSRLVFFSTDFVFSGENKWETIHGKPNPKSVYAKSKLNAEKLVLELGNNAAIIRPVLVYGYSPVAGRPNIFTWVLDSLINEKNINVVSDQIRTPTFVNDVVELTTNIMVNSLYGIFHIGGSQQISVYEFACAIARGTGNESNLISPVNSQSLSGAELRPINSCFKLEGLNVGDQNPLNVEKGIREALLQIQDFQG